MGHVKWFTLSCSPICTKPFRGLYFLAALEEQTSLILFSLIAMRLQFRLKIA